VKMFSCLHLAVLAGTGSYLHATAAKQVGIHTVEPVQFERANLPHTGTEQLVRFTSRRE
jgi:hypothetical protein